MERNVPEGSVVTESIGEAITNSADRALDVMTAASWAIKGGHWNEAEELLKKLQVTVHQLRVDIRSERLPIRSGTVAEHV
jgi:hypothetical protein